MHSVDRVTFEALVEAAVAGLPSEFREHIENVAFVVEDSASPEDLRRAGTRHGSTLLGLYRGVPLPRRSSGYNLTSPDIIAIFQQPLERSAHDLDHLASLVEHVVRHEVAHYFGISDERLRELGAY